MTDPTEHDGESTNGRSRRNILKTAGITMGAGIAGLGAVTGSAAAEKSISHEDVDPDDPESVERFIRRSYELGETKQVIQAYQNLSEKQLQAVRDGIDRLSTVTLETTERTTSTDVTPMSVWIERTATLEKSAPFQTIHKTTHTLGFQVFPEYDLVAQPSHSSTGSAPAPFWYHNGLFSSYLAIQDNNTEVNSSRAHKYTHSAGAEIEEESATIDMRGHGEGFITVVNKEITDL